MLKRIGYWRGDGQDHQWPHPRAFVLRGWRTAEKARIVAYLRAGLRLREFLGYSHCRFRGGPPDEEMGNAELTDGVWLWPEGLWVYVERFDVRLPEELVEHMRRNGFRIPDGLDAAELEGLPVDLEFWRSWCKREGLPPREP